MHAKEKHTLSDALLKIYELMGRTFTRHQKAVEKMTTFFTQLTALDLHGALLGVVRIQMEIHRARQDERQPANRKTGIIKLE